MMNEWGNGALGALIATAVFLLSFAVISLRVFGWFKRAGFRFSNISAQQDDDGVKLNVGFKRAGFGTAGQVQVHERRAPTMLPPVDSEDDTERPPPDSHTSMFALAADNLARGDRVAVTEEKGWVRLATSMETPLGVAAHHALKGTKVEIHVPKGSLLDPYRMPGQELRQ